jgi:hypothetical protein
MTCDSTGTRYESTLECAFSYSALRCVEGAEGAFCNTPACANPTCNGETLTCEGSAPVACSAGQVCTFGPKSCDTVAVDSDDLWEGTEYGAFMEYNWMLGRFYNVTNGRKLINIETILRGALTDVTWFVYEAPSESCDMVNIFQTDTSPPQTGLNGTGPIDVSLVAGKRYFIGFMLHGSGARLWNSPNNGSNTVSFGTVDDFYNDDGQAVTATRDRCVASGLVFRVGLRLTTAAP